MLKAPDLYAVHPPLSAVIRCLSGEHRPLICLEIIVFFTFPQASIFSCRFILMPNMYKLHNFYCMKYTIQFLDSIIFDLEARAAIAYNTLKPAMDSFSFHK